MRRNGFFNNNQNPNENNNPNNQHQNEDLADREFTAEEMLLLNAPPLQLVRQLGITYTDPRTGGLTSDDPNDYRHPHQQAERTALENAILREHPDTGIALGIRERRAQAQEQALQAQVQQHRPQR